MRVALFTDNFRKDMGGGTKIVVDLAKGLKERGHEVLVVTGQLLDEASKDFNVLSLPSLRVPFYDKAEMVFPSVSLVKRLKEFDPDIIHFHEPFTAGLLAVMVGKATRKKVVGSIHIDPKHLSQYSIRIDRGGIAKALVGFMQRQTNATLFISEYQRRTYSRFLSRKVPARVIYPGVPDYFFREVSSKKEKRVVTVCRLAPEKNLKFAFRVMAEVQRRVEVQYTVVGDGPERKKLEKYAKRIGLEVEFLGRVEREKLPDIYASSSLLFLPSKTETFGLVFAEAMACGTPVVALKKGSAPEVVGEGGMLCEEEVEEVAKAIVRLLRDDTLSSSLSERARKRAEMFRMERFIEEHERVYEGLLYK